MKAITVVLMSLTLLACGSGERPTQSADAHAEGPAAESERGPHRGKMLVDGPFAIELAIFESGVPPEYHAWPTLNGKPVPLDQVELTVELERLGNRRNTFTFSPKE